MESVEPKRLTYGVNVVWVGTVLDESTIEDFEKWFLEKYHYHIEYKDEFHITSGMFKDLNCIIFAVPFEEVPRFSIFRLRTNDMKWLIDFYDGEKENIPQHIIDKYELDLYSKFDKWKEDYFQPVD